MMRRGVAHGINAGQDRTDRAIDNRIRRDVGGGVDDVTHRDPPQAFLRTEQKVLKQTMKISGNCEAAAACQFAPNRTRSRYLGRVITQLTDIGKCLGCSPAQN